MKWSDLKLMAIGGNCASMYLLGGDKRIHGPFDNIVVEKVNALKLLFENKYLEYIKNSQCTKIDTPHPKEGEPKFSSIFDCGVTIIHNDPKTDRYLETLQVRINNFNAFYKNLSTNYFFIFVLNQRTTYYGTKQLRGTLLVDILEYLKSIKLLDKTIFIGTEEAKDVTDPWTYYNYSLNDNDLKYLRSKYQLNYIQLNDLNLQSEEGKIEAHNQFKKKLVSYLERNK